MAHGISKTKCPPVYRTLPRIAFGSTLNSYKSFQTWSLLHLNALLSQLIQRRTLYFAKNIPSFVSKDQHK
jgi:hypothetical protein